MKMYSVLKSAHVPPSYTLPSYNPSNLHYDNITLVDLRMLYIYFFVGSFLNWFARIKKFNISNPIKYCIIYHVFAGK